MIDFYKAIKHKAIDQWDDRTSLELAKLLNSAFKNVPDDGIDLSAIGMKEEQESVTYGELVAKINANALVPGRKYRITNYTCKIMSDEAIAMNHVFDIIVTADTKNTLYEDASAAHHEGDTYFANSNLNAWKLKYDVNGADWGELAGRFCSVELEGCTFMARVTESTDDVDGFPCRLELLLGKEVCFTLYIRSAVAGTYQPSDYYYLNDDDELVTNEGEYGEVCASLFETKTGHVGTITYMRDEFGNECGYDFKNICFSLNKISEIAMPDSDTDFSGALDGLEFPYGYETETITVDENDVQVFYTFATLDGNDASLTGECNNNSISAYDCLLSNVFFGSANNVHIGAESEHNVLVNCEDMTAGYEFENNYIVNGCSTAFGNRCSENVVTIRCSECVFGDYVQYNIFYGSSIYKIELSEYVGMCEFGSTCQEIKIREQGTTLKFVSSCSEIEVGKSCSNISFNTMNGLIKIGDFCKNITFGKAYTSCVKIGDFVTDVVLTSDETTYAYSPLKNVLIPDGVADKTLKQNDLGSTSFVELK